MWSRRDDHLRVHVHQVNGIGRIIPPQKISLNHKEHGMQEEVANASTGLVHRKLHGDVKKAKFE